MAAVKKSHVKKASKKAEKVGRCQTGYEPTPGKKPYSKGSCKPKTK